MSTETIDCIRLGTRAPKPVEATLKSLWREFRRCSDRYPPLYHELFGPWSDFSQFEAQDVCESFRQAFEDRFHDGWEEWHGSGDVPYFGRFFGNSEGLEEFKKLAESACLVMCEIGPTFENFVYPVDLGFHGWLKLLNDMADGYPTPLLRCEYSVWDWDESDQARMFEEAERVGTLEDGTPYPLHPVHWRLAHPLFMSSMAAIELILDADRGLLIGDSTLGLPVSFSGGIDEHEPVTPVTGATTQNETTVEMEEGFSAPLEDRAARILNTITKRLDALEGASDSEVTDGPTPFGDLWHDGRLFELALTQLEVRLLNALWKPKQRDTESLCEDVYGQDDLKYSGIKDVKKRINKKFRDSKCPLYLKTKGDFYHLIECQQQQ
jgi:hypothetical protein